SQVRARLNFNVAPQYAIRELDPFGDFAAVPEDVEAVQNSLGVNVGLLAKIRMALFDFFLVAGERNFDHVFQDVGVGQTVFEQVSDIFPIAIRDVAIEWRLRVQKRREKVLGEIKAAV